MTTLLSASAVPHLDTPQARASLAAQAAHFFTFASPLVLLVNALALVAARVGVGVASGDAGAASAAWMSIAVAAATAAWWPLQEWLFHRVLLHLRPRRVFGFLVDPHFARAHRAHHKQPWIVEQTLLPLRVLAVLVPAQALWLLVPSTTLALTAAATYAISALVYEWVHYLCHSHYVPRSAYYRRIWRNHRLHHFKNERHWFSFTVPAVDAWLGTEPHVDDVATSSTVRTLGVDARDLSDTD